MKRPRQTQSFDTQAMTGWPLFQRIPRQSKKLQALSTRSAEHLLALINSDDAQRLRDNVEEMFGVSVDELLLFHEGDGDGPGLKTQLREHIERQISARTLRDFRFQSDRHFRRFAIDSCILWRFYGFAPQLEHWYADNWARGFIVQKPLDYFRQIALAHQGMVEKSVENFHFMRARFPKFKRRHYKGDWKPELMKWLTATRLKPDLAKRDVEDAERLFQFWAKAASEDERTGWRAFFVGIDRDNREYNLPTSLLEPRRLEGSTYFEVWRYWDSASDSWIDTGNWIEISRGHGIQATFDERRVMTEARDALADACPSHVGLSSRLEISVAKAKKTDPPVGFVEKPKGGTPTVHILWPGDEDSLTAAMNTYSRCLGPWLDTAEAQNAAERLRSKGLATGNVIEGRLTLTFHRPAAPEQWKRPR